MPKWKFRVGTPHLLDVLGAVKTRAPINVGLGKKCWTKMSQGSLSVEASGMRIPFVQKLVGQCMCRSTPRIWIVNIVRASVFRYRNLLMCICGWTSSERHILVDTPRLSDENALSIRQCRDFSRSCKPLKSLEPEDLWSPRFWNALTLLKHTNKICMRQNCESSFKGQQHQPYHFVDTYIKPGRRPKSTNLVECY